MYYMKRKPTSNPQIDGKPMSFVKLESTVAKNFMFRRTDKGAYKPLMNGEFSIRDVPYKVVEGTLYRVKKENSRKVEVPSEMSEG